MTFQDESLKRLRINPVQPLDDGQTAKNPPAVAHVLELLRTSIQAAALQLPLAQPSTKQVSINKVKATRNAEGGDADEDLA